MFLERVEDVERDFELFTGGKRFERNAVEHGFADIDVDVEEFENDV